MWASFSKEELINAIDKCNNSSTSGPDKLLWRHIKRIVKNNKCTIKLIDIVNTCINLGHWLSYFKMSTIVIISKPNKDLYNLPKSFHPIVLLNTIGKLFEKMIGERLQFLLISNNFIYSYQLSSLKYKSTTDAGIALTYALTYVIQLG